MTSLFFTLVLIALVFSLSVSCQNPALASENASLLLETQVITEKKIYHVFNRMEQPAIAITSITDTVRAVNREPLSADNRRVILQACISIIEGINPNFNIRNRFLNINPVLEMKRFLTKAPSVSNLKFHVKMKKIFNSMRNGHTRYTPPASLLNVVAGLGISIEPFVNRSTNRLEFIISEVAESALFIHGNITLGVVVLSIDGIPVETLTKQLGRQFGASNEPSLIRFGSRSLTVRSLAFDTIPSRPAATVRYLTKIGTEESIDIPWVYLKGFATPETETALSNARGLQADNFQSMLVQKRWILKQLTKRISVTKQTMLLQKNDLVPHYLKQYLKAAQLTTENGTFAYLAVESFIYPPTIRAFQDLRKIISKLPRNGLIIDVRGNDGGFVNNTYMLLRTFSNVSIGTYPAVGRVSRLALKYAKRTGSPDPQVYKTAIRLGEPYTGPIFDIFSETFRKNVDRFNPIFNGPVVAIADGASLSAGEIFATFCRDYRVCQLINVDGSTAGLGDAVSYYSALKRVGNVTFFPDFPLNISISSASLRIFRSGIRSGAPISFFGVEPDVKYNYTKEDILNDNQDLLRFAGKQLMALNS